MRSLLLVLALGACYRDAPAPVAPQPRDVPAIRFAIAVGTTVQIVRTTATGLVVERTMPVPAIVSRLFWIGRDPAVWLDMSVGQQGEGFPTEFFDEEPVPPGPHQNAMGLVTDAGFVRFAPLAWPPAKRPGGDFDDTTDEVTTPNAALIAGKDALWERRCRWYGGPDGGWCTYEHRVPAPVVFVEKIDEAESPAFPTVAPAQRIVLGHTTRLREPDNADMNEWENKQELLTCTPRGGDAVVYPPAGELDHNVREEVVWLSTEPPIFLTRESGVDAGVGRGPAVDEKIWEGCSPSARYDAATTGPNDIVVLSGRELAVLLRGREIGHLASGGDHPAFAR